MEYRIFKEKELNVIRAYCIVPFVGGEVLKTICTVVNVPDNKVEYCKETIEKSDYMFNPTIDFKYVERSSKNESK